MKILPMTEPKKPCQIQQLQPLPPSQRIAILGAECSGKSTLTTALAAHLGRTAQGVAEYARSRWDAVGSSGFGYADMLAIAQTQVQLEEQIAAAAPPECRFLLCDTTPLTTLFYCLDAFGKAPLALWGFSTRAYGAVLLCVPDFAFVQDGQRTGDAFRQRQHAWLVSALAERDIAPVVLHGDVPTRVQRALMALAVVEKSLP